MTSDKQIALRVRDHIPNEGVLDRAGTNARRRENLKNVKTEAGFDRDEAPAAVINTGKHSSVKHIPKSDNRGASASIGQQIKDVPDGTRVRLLPKYV